MAEGCLFGLTVCRGGKAIGPLPAFGREELRRNGYTVLPDTIVRNVAL
jgi:hypothetical protein